MIHIIHGDAAGPSSWDAVWLWLGCGLMVVGVLAIIGLATRMRREDRSHVVPALFVNLIATCSYFAMATGQLNISIGGDHVLELPRYLDWQTTTPLLVLSLAMIALPSVHHFARSRERTAIVGGLMGAQALLILTGIFATLQFTPALKWVWYGISCACQIGVWYLQWGVILPRSAEHGGKAHRLYRGMLTYLTVLWLAYPIVWALGPTGAKLFGLTPSAAIYTGLDVSAKTVFNIALLAGLLRLGRTVQTVRGHETIELLAGDAPDEIALDEQARTGRVHLEPAPTGGVLIGASTNGRSEH